MVKDVWIHQGIYGKMTQIAQDYQISRTFLSQLTWSAQHLLAILFRDPQPVVTPPESLFEPLILLARLEGNCSIPSLSAILKRLAYRPNSITLEAQSTAILKIQLASDRCAPTWQTHFEDLRDHHFHSIGMASDRGVGLVAGYQAACQDAIWVCDQFHEFQDLFKRCHQLDRKAYA